MEQIRLTLNKTFGDVAEEQKWQEFVDYQDEAKPSAQMPDGCYTCKVGSRWSEADNELLISMVQPGVTLEDMARELNRSLLGIVGRLQLMGIIRVEDSRYDNFYYNRFVSNRTMEYRYKVTRKLCYDMKPFMESNAEKLGWERVPNGFYLPIEIRDKKVDKGKFNPSWKRRTEPERVRARNEKMEKKKEETRNRKKLQRNIDLGLRSNNPRYKKDGTLDRRYLGQK